MAWRVEAARPSPGELHVVRVTPAGEVSAEATSRIVVEFGSAIDPRTVKPDSLTLVPRAAGTTSLEGRALRFVLAERLKDATRYRIVISPDLRGARGETVAEGRHHFWTPPLRVLGVSQARIERDRSSVIEFRFSTPVNPLELAEHLAMRYPDGSAVAFGPVGGMPGRSLRVRVPATRFERMLVEIAPGLAGIAGPLPLGRAYRRTVRVAAKLRFIGMTASHRRGRSVIAVRTNSPLDAVAAPGYVKIEPEVRHTFDSSRSGLVIVGDFDPGGRYRVTLRAGLPAGAAGALEKDVTRAVSFDDRPPELRFALDGGYLSPRGLLKVPVRSVNVKRARLTVERLYESNLVEYVLRSDGWLASDLSTDLPETEIALRGARNVEAETLVDLRRVLRSASGDECVGVHGLTLRRDKRRWHYNHAVVVVTDLGISARLGGPASGGAGDGGPASRSAGTALVWVTSISTAEPVEGARVSVYSDRRQRLGSGITGADGVARVALASPPAGETSALVVAGKGRDLSYLNLAGGARSRGAAASTGRPYLVRGYEIFATSERGVYRPGDTARLSALVRGVEWETPPPMPLALLVYMPGGRKLLEKAVVTDSSGRVLSDVELPRAAPSGSYRALYRLPGSDEALGSCSFRLADYVPRTLRMTLEAPGGPLPAKEPFEVKARVEHLFGDAARGLGVRCRVRVRAAAFRPAGWRGYRFGDPRRGWGSSRLDLPAAKLDGEGRASFLVRAPSVSTPARLSAEVEVEVREAGGRALAERLRRTLDPWDFHVGVKPPEEGIEPGASGVFSLAAVSPGGEAHAGAERYRAELFRVNHRNVLRRVDGGRLRYEWTRHEKLVSAAEGEFRNGRASPSLTVEFGGSYRLVVTPEGGCPVTHDFHVSGPGAAWAMEDPERLQLSFDRGRYRPGETARLSVRAPFGGTAFVCVETDRVLDTRVVDLAGGEGELALRVAGSWRPNVYVTATLVRAVEPEEEWRPHRASGAARLDVDCADRRLALALASPDSARPGRKLELGVAVCSGDEPVRGAAVVLAAVDEGVLALTGHRTPAPFEFFYGTRRLGVREFDMFSRLAPELAAWKVEGAPEPGGGGAPGGAAAGELARRLNPIDAARVKTAVLYAGTLTTGEDGVARASFTVPEYAGELRVIAFASAGARFGSAEKALPVKSPIMVRASWPRFLAPGDEFELPVTVFNRTGRDGVAELDVGVEGPLHATEALPLEVEIPAGGEKTVHVRLASDGAGKALARVVARLGDEEYAECVELPVRPAAAFARRAGLVTVDGGGETHVTPAAGLAAGGAFLRGTARCSLVVAGTPAVELAGALGYLIRYPYGCVEQTTSRMVPLVYLRDLTELSEPDLVGADELDALMRAGFMRLRMMQTYGGGLATWPGRSRAYPWGSIYAAGMLVEARKSGCDVPEDLLEPLLGYLEGRLGEWAASRGEGGRPSMFGEAAYACAALASAGRPPRSWMARLEELAREEGRAGRSVPASARFHLAAAFLASGEARAAGGLVAGAGGPTSTRRELRGYLDSPVREAAIMLSVLLDVDPDSPRVAEFTDRLRRRTKLGRWGTTQENAFALMALGKHARRVPPAEGEGTVTLADGRRHVFDAKRGLRLAGLDPEEPVRIRFDGKGKLRAFWQAEGAPEDGRAEEEDSGLSIRRRFLERDGRTSLGANVLRQGRVYFTELTVEADQALDNLVIVDLLPAGLEIEDPNLKGSARSASETGSRPWRRLRADLVERRDDRIIVFGRCRAGKSVFTYAVRAVTPGRFVLPAADASCMYDPELHSVHGRGVVEVRR